MRKEDWQKWKDVVELLDRDQRKSNILQSRHLNILKVDTFMTK